MIYFVEPRAYLGENMNIYLDLSQTEKPICETSCKISSLNNSFFSHSSPHYEHHAH